MNMNKHLFFTALFVGNALFCAADKPAKAATLLGTDHILQGAIIAHDRADMEPVAVMFRGERTTVDKNGFFSFVKKNDHEVFEPVSLKKKMSKPVKDIEASVAPVASPMLTPTIKHDKFYLLISQNFEHVAEGLNDVSGFRQVAGKPHLFFSFIAQNSTRPNGEIVIKPTSLEKRNYVYAPDRTIVVALNPNRVKKLEYWPFELGSQFVQLPRIVLLSEEEIRQRKIEKNPELEDVLAVDANNLARQAVKSNFLSLELKPFFEDQDKVVVWKKQRTKDLPVKVEMIVY